MLRLRPGIRGQPVWVVNPDDDIVATASTSSSSSSLSSLGSSSSSQSSVSSTSSSLTSSAIGIGFAAIGSTFRIANDESSSSSSSSSTVWLTSSSSSSSSSSLSSSSHSSSSSSEVRSSSSSSSSSTVMRSSSSSSTENERRALGFDGQNSVTHDASWIPWGVGKAFTVECWIKTTQTSVIISEIGNAGDNWNGLEFFLDGNGHFCANMKWGGASWVNRNVADGQWHHVGCMVSQGQNWGINYVWTVAFADGEIVQGANANNVAMSSNMLRLAKRVTSTWAINQFVGRIDEFCISDVGRYGGNFIPQRNLPVDPHTLLYWKFDEGSGTTAHDSTANNHNGTLQGSPLPQWVAGCNPI